MCLGMSRCEFLPVLGWGLPWLLMPLLPNPMQCLQVIAALMFRYTNASRKDQT